MLLLPPTQELQENREELIDQLGNFITDTIPQMNEALQIWNASGHLLYANPATLKYFPVKEIVNVRDLLVICRQEDGSGFNNNSFPVVQVLNNKQACENVLIQVKNRWLYLNVYPLMSKSNILFGALSTSHDISFFVEKGLKLEFDAHYDPLTGLANRSLLFDRMHMAMARVERSGQSLAICMMDLDGFKPVNDTLGHEAGDLLLKELAQRLKNTLRNQDSAIRLGGDEFVLLLNDFKSETECDLALHRLMNTVAKPFNILNKQVNVTASIGVTLYPIDNSVADQLIRHADQAMYKAKAEGKNCYQLFDPTLESRLKANKGLIKRIEKALLSEQLVLHYQPKVDCVQQKVIGMEALLRWEHPILGIRPPGEFLPLIEQNDLIIEFGNWVIKAVMKQLQTWESQGLSIPISLNISARHFVRGNFEEHFDKLIKEYSPELLNNLEIEILETAALEDMNKVSHIINQYKKFGIKFSLDDFGTGYSSLVHLKHLKVDTLKIDQSFVKEMNFDPGNLAIIQGIIGLAKAFQINVIAEGVETMEQNLMLLELGCHKVQGYHLARPMPANKVPAWLKEFTPDPRWQVASKQYPSRNEFDLLQLEVSHRFWLQTIADKCDCIEKEMGHEHDYSHCRLTQWYNKFGMKEFASLPDFHNIDELHREVHQLADNILMHKKDNKFGKLNDKLRQANEKLVQKLHEFRTELLSSNKTINHSF